MNDRNTLQYSVIRFVNWQLKTAISILTLVSGQHGTGVGVEERPEEEKVNQTCFRVNNQ